MLNLKQFFAHLSQPTNAESSSLMKRAENYGRIGGIGAGLALGIGTLAAFPILIPVVAIAGAAAGAFLLPIADWNGSPASKAFNALIGIPVGAVAAPLLVAAGGGALAGRALGRALASVFEGAAPAVPPATTTTTTTDSIPATPGAPKKSFSLAALTARFQSPAARLEASRPAAPPPETAKPEDKGPKPGQ